MPPTRTHSTASATFKDACRKASSLRFAPRATRSGASFSPYELVLDGVDLDALYSQRMDGEAGLAASGDEDIAVLPGRALPKTEELPEDLDEQPSHTPSPPAPSVLKRTTPRPVSRCPLPRDPQNPTKFCFQSPPISPTPKPDTLLSSSQAPLSAKDNAKRKSKAKRAATRAKEAADSPAPYLKGVALQRARKAVKQQVRVLNDAAELAHSLPAWIGLRDPANEASTEPPTLGIDAEVLEGQEYSQEDVDKLAKAYGLRYLRWNGRESVAIVDLRRRLLALLGGQPSGANWPSVVEGATVAMEELAPRVRLTKAKLSHRRAQTPFCAVARGVSHGGGQTEPGELLVNAANKRVTDELLQHGSFKQIVGFTTYLFWLWMPVLYTAYFVARERYADEMPWLRFPFECSVFAACTWNFVSTVCAPHVDFANLVWGWCAITALGRFNPDRGGHLILWELGLIIRFPPGATIFIPSALLSHSNTPIGLGETRSSFVQYSAGGLFRWIEQKFQTQASFDRTASDAEKEEAAERAKNRWAYGLGHFTIIDELIKSWAS